jgi:hypothetical protein
MTQSTNAVCHPAPGALSGATLRQGELLVGQGCGKEVPMPARDKHLAVLKLNIAILRNQLTAIAGQSDRGHNRQFVIRELFSSEITYYALIRKRRQQLAAHALGA